MPVELARMLDPELIIPSSESARDLAFWQRLFDLSNDHGVRVGVATLESLHDLLASPPALGRLSSGDFWTIIGKFTQRALAADQDSRDICSSHICLNYKPALGADTNLERLLVDLELAGPHGRIALRSVAECWSDLPDNECPTCRDSKVSIVIEPAKDAQPDTLYASAWREAYLDEGLSDVAEIMRHASLMFPALRFSDVAWNYLGTLRGSPTENSKLLFRHLSILNDAVVDLWEREANTATRQAEMSALGAPCSLEGPKTHKHKSAMNARQFDFNGDRVQCEWHTKLHPAYNRIYFSVAKDNVLVGAIIDHLPT